MLRHPRKTLPVVAALWTLVGAFPAHAADPAEVLQRFGFPAGSAEQVMAGQFVTRDLPTTSDRDLNVGMAFLVKQPPEAVTAKLRSEGALLRADPGNLASAEIKDDGSPDQFAGLKLTAAEVQAYAAAAPGSDLNLSTQEVAALKAAAGKPEALQQAVVAQLLARYRAYRSGGLAGIAAYDRGGAASSPADDLRSDNAFLRKSGKVPAALCDLLEQYPASKPSDLQEKVRWQQFTAHGTDTLALVHTMTGTFDGNLVAVQRQFYVSSGYNVEQAVVGFLPVDGGTLVVYTNHTSTDQVAGFGGSAKRSIGRKLMASQLQSIFETTRGAIAH